MSPHCFLMNSGHPERFTIASTFRALCLGHERADSVHAHRYRGMGDGGPELMWDLVAMTACADVPELQPLTHFGRERRQRCPASACGCSSTEAGLCPAVHKGRCALLVHRIRLLHTPRYLSLAQLQAKYMQSDAWLASNAAQG